MNIREHDALAGVREATLKHRAEHGCGAWPYGNGQLLSALAGLFAGGSAQAAAGQAAQAADSAEQTAAATAPVDA